MSDQSARLALPYIQPSQAQKHVTHNEALQTLDLLVQLVVEGFDASTPPALPEDGQVWALGAAPSGDWAGQAQMLAAWVQGGWVFIEPQPGWRAWGRAEEALRLWTGTEWVAPETAAPDFDNLSGVGINTGFDATNRLSVAAAATLLSHEGAGHQLKINKADAGDTASLLFQTGFSGRAEMGTAGEDDFSFKVSPDGSAWITALRIAAASGQMSGEAVQADATDTTPGRVLKLAEDGTGAFGLGSSGGDGPPLIEDFEAELIPGFYRYVESTTTGAPGPGNPYAGYAVVLRTNSGHPGAFAWRRTMNPANLKVFFGTRASATGAMLWNELWHQGNLLGSVSQSGGMPTGAVFQHGANSNGQFERRASGWMECIRTDLAVTGVDTTAGSLHRSADVSWTFPSAFMSGEAPVVSIAADHADAIGFSVVSISETAMTFRIIAHSAITDSVPIRASATGRWSDMS